MKMNRDAMLTFMATQEWIPGANLPTGWIWSMGDITDGGLLPITKMDFLAEKHKDGFAGV